MVTKWKSSLTAIGLGLLVTFAVSGIILFIGIGNYYAQKDYFHTEQFQYEIEEFSNYVSMFELYDMSLEEAKKAIIVTDEEINEHRYRYGSLAEQIDNINLQYQNLIQEALDTESQKLADTYIAERDTKKADITKNFESDGYVEAKVIKEKEQMVEEAYQEAERFRADFESLKKTFTYIFEGTNTREIYTNLDSKSSEAQVSVADMNTTNMLYVTDYQLPNDYNASYFSHFGYEIEMNASELASDQLFTGKIGIAKTLSPSNQFIIKYENYKTEKFIFWSLVAAGILSFFLSLYLLKKVRIFNAWQSYYNKLPIDVRGVFFGLTGVAAIFATFLIVDNIQFILDESLRISLIRILWIMIASVSWGVTMIQGRFLFATVKEWSKLKQEWDKSLIKKWTKAIQVQMHKMSDSLREAFLNQTTGIQIFFVLGVVFLLGFSVLLIAFHPIFIIFYIVLIGSVGIPLAIRLVNQIGYFNRIVLKTNELAEGRFGNDLSISGDSVLSKLATNINLLKYGVKISQTEQVKSERLKTELITNVSHDLRTPLTSIITYTELLKKENISIDDRNAYIEIIDRKSQRLKVLIEDLFEVSKMASGNIQLTKEKIDLVQLLQQALAEYDDTINNSSLQFRVSKNDQPVYSLVDGQKLWRVFDNLIGNILKYSLEYSRVYMQLTTNNNQAIITFKNVSKYELNENSEELFERFKRGDTSRNTEGSGLGLAIAQSIIDLHEGKLEVETDGDLFKVTISLKIED